jgi:ABC-type nickel/cobalt efflux system permease component RcnA
MIAILVVVGLLILATGLLFTLGAGVVALIPLVLLVGIGGWMLWAMVSGMSPGAAPRRAEKAELLGPGGPDDPDRNAPRSDT